MDHMWVGADPGGAGNFGVALLHDEGHYSTACVSCADETMGFVSRGYGKPLGAGIDAPMWWSGGLSGDRAADQWIRKRYHVASGTVQAANSLRGAALVQGALFAERIRFKFPGLPLTESHPKALLLVLGLPGANESTRWTDFCKRFSISGEHATEHERDAVIGAVAAREGFQGRWLRDLAQSRLVSEQDPSAYWLAPMRYFWPD